MIDPVAPDKNPAANFLYKGVFYLSVAPKSYLYGSYRP